MNLYLRLDNISVAGHFASVTVDEFLPHGEVTHATWELRRYADGSLGYTAGFGGASLIGTAENVAAAVAMQEPRVLPRRIRRALHSIGDDQIGIVGEQESALDTGGALRRRAVARNHGCGIQSVAVEGARQHCVPVGGRTTERIREPAE